MLMPEFHVLNMQDFITAGDPNPDRPLQALLQGTWANGPDPYSYWLLKNFSFTGTLTQRPVANGPLVTPISGVFVCTNNTPLETFAESSTGQGWEPSKRQMVIPMDCTSQLMPNGQYAFTCTDMLQKDWPIYPGFNLRCLYSSLPGAAAPGPGVLSSCYGYFVIEVIRAQRRA